MSSQEACKFSSSYTLLGRGKSWKYFYFAFEKTGRKEKFATRIYRESASEIGEKKKRLLDSWTTAYSFTKNIWEWSLLGGLRGWRRLIALTEKWCLCKRRIMIINTKQIWKVSPFLWQFFKDSCCLSLNTKLVKSNFLLSLQKVTNHYVQLWGATVLPLQWYVFLRWYIPRANWTL